jgi:flagellar motor switch protein FliM
VTTDLLSQHDIDRLLDGGSGPAGAGGVNVDVQVYDFRRPHRVSKERLRTLEAMYERMVKSLEGWLIGRVRGQVEMRLQSVEQFSFGEFTLSLPTPCATYVFDVADSGGQQGVIDIGHDFSYFLVDRLFGGSGVPSILGRALTPVERMAVRSVADRVASLLEEVWQDYVPLELEISGFESAPEILQIANREDPVLVANVEVSAGQTSSLLLICLPFSVLDKFFSASGQKRINTMTGTEREKEAARERAEGSLRATRVPVCARLPAFPLTLRELSALEPGSVLSTGIPRDCQLQVLVGEQERFRGSAGRVGRRLAVRLLDSISPPNGQSSDDAEEPIA